MPAFRRAPVLFGVWLAAACSPEAMDRAGPEGPFIATASIPPTPDGKDVIVHLARFRFGDEQRVRDLAARLEGEIPRPWTVERLAAHFAAAQKREHRATLIYLLAASRSSFALRIVGNALRDEEPVVAIAAAEGIEFYWIGVSGGGSADAMLQNAEEWWRERSAALRGSTVERSEK